MFSKSTPLLFSELVELNKMTKYPKQPLNLELKDTTKFSYLSINTDNFCICNYVQYIIFEYLIETSFIHKTCIK